MGLEKWFNSIDLYSNLESLLCLLNQKRIFLFCVRFLAAAQNRIAIKFLTLVNGKPVFKITHVDLATFGKSVDGVLVCN